MNFHKLLASLFVSLALATTAHADYSFYSAISLVPGAIAQGNILFSADGSFLGINTTDGADNKYNCIATGTACSRTRGAFIALNGNEVASVGGNIDINTGDGANDIVNIYKGANLIWTFGGATGALTQDATNGDDIVISKNGSGLRKSGTGDVLQLSGGSTLNSTTAGGGLSLFGGASGGSQGIARLFGGNQTTGHVEIQTNNASAEIRLQTNASTKFIVNNAGSFVQDATNGGSIVLSKAGTAVANPVTSGLTATGAVIGTALQLTFPFSQVSTVAAGTGVRLPDLSTGALIIVRNSGANALLVYPLNDAASNIDGLAVGASVSIAPGSTGVFFRASSTAFYSLEAAAA